MATNNLYVEHIILSDFHPVFMYLYPSLYMHVTRVFRWCSRWHKSFGFFNPEVGLDLDSRRDLIYALLVLHSNRAIRLRQVLLLTSKMHNSNTNEEGHSSAAWSQTHQIVRDCPHIQPVLMWVPPASSSKSIPSLPSLTFGAMAEEIKPVR